MMRAKMKITAVDTQYEGQENITFHAVTPNEAYPADGTDENNTYARWTPCAVLNITIQNPNLFGKLKVDCEYYLDFTKAD